MKYILWILGTSHASAFVVERCTPTNRGTFSPFAADADVACSSTRPATRHFELSTRLGSSLFSTPPKRVARRDLKKRNRRKRVGYSKFTEEDKALDSNVNIETRPLIRSKKIEAGEDYWIEEEELKKYSEREKAIKNRKAMEGEISIEKLKEEVVAPYKQNWIGFISVGIIVLAVIVKEFPELLNTPMIPIPDL